LRGFWQTHTDHLFAYWRRKQLLRKDFSVICNNCLAGTWIYDKYNLPYLTPTVGVYIPSEDYLFLLENFELLITQPIRIQPVDKKRHPKPYPVGILSDKVEIHFFHLKNETEAKEKWTERVKRINYNNLFFIFSDHEGFDEEQLSRYAKLPYKNKIYFSGTNCKKYGKTVVYIKDFSKQGHVDERLISNRRYGRYFDLVKWLNGEEPVGSCK
jgi:uncharacterized protein (DUF1919 family)